MRVSKLVQSTASAYLRGKIGFIVLHCVHVDPTGVTGQMMSDVLFFVSCIEIIVCMFAVMRFHILMFLVKVFSDFSSRYC